MRNIFNALIKVIGIWMIYLGIEQLIKSVYHILTTIIANRMQIPPAWMPKFEAWSYVYLMCSGLYFILAWVLIFKTDWVADKAKVPKDENQCTPLDRSALLPIGIQLVGFYFLLIAIPDLVYGLYDSSSEGIDRAYSIWHFVYVNFTCLVQICLAIMCVFKANAIVKFVSDKSNLSWTKMAALSLLASGILVILIRIIVSALAQNLSLITNH